MTTDQIRNLFEDPAHDQNPWLTQPSRPHTAEPLFVEPPAAPMNLVHAGVQAPQRGLPRHTRHEQSPLWWLGTHGGAGESTLERLVPGSIAAGHAWPLSAQRGLFRQVMLVARSNTAGLASAQQAAAEWASGQFPELSVVGLVVMSDAPGRLPKSLRDHIRVASGGVPRLWTVPWIEQWRHDEVSSSRPIARILKDLATSANIQMKGIDQ